MVFATSCCQRLTGLFYPASDKEGESVGVFLNAIARTVPDAALILGAIAGRDPRDPESSPKQVPNYLSCLKDGIRGKTFGIPRKLYWENIVDTFLTYIRNRDPVSVVGYPAITVPAGAHFSVLVA